MKVAIIGGGISGLTCAWLLHKGCDITVFEAERRPGGHSNTVEFQHEGKSFSIDTGFIVYNDRTYPNFITLLSELGISGVPTSMSFAVRCDRTGIEYCGSGLRGVFAQKSNLLKPAFLKMVVDILRFNRQGTADVDRVPSSMTVGEYLSKNRFGKRFAEHYLLPMGASIWSCPTGTFSDFPIQFILEFYRNHGLLSLTNRPQWYTIPGGSREYVNRLTAAFSSRIVSGTPVRRVQRNGDSVLVSTDGSDTKFDEVIFACHSDQVLSILQDASDLERSAMVAFPYEKNEAVLHSDTSILPRSRAAWSAWNYRIGVERASQATLTYNMNILQHIQSNATFCVTLNDTAQIDPKTIISKHLYSHPLFTIKRAEMQAQHSLLIRNNRTSFCGAYWGNGFHEDGVNSALAVCRQFGVRGFRSASTSNVSSTSEMPDTNATADALTAARGTPCA